MVLFRQKPHERKEKMAQHLPQLCADIHEEPLTVNREEEASFFKKKCFSALVSPLPNSVTFPLQLQEYQKIFFF